MKRVLCIIIVVFFMAVSGNVIASDIMSLDYDGRATTKAYLTKDKVNMVVDFDYVVGNHDQREYFQDIFDKVYTTLEKEGWERTGYFSQDELTLTISITYAETGKAMGIFLHRKYKKGGGYGILVRGYEDDQVARVVTSLKELQGKKNPAG